MIIPLQPRLTDEQVREITEIAVEFSVGIQPIHGTQRSIYALVGDETSQELINRIEGLPYIDRIDRVQTPYKLMARESKLAPRSGEHAGLIIGGVPPPSSAT
jgi:3-deoxy-7-phosphoheptulonate synthase